MNKGTHLILEDIRGITKRIKKESKQLEGRTVLITGGIGFIGKYFLYTLSYFNKHIFRKPVRIISLDNAITGQHRFFNDLLDPSIQFIKHDVRSYINVDGAVDYVIHAAGIASPVFYTKYPLETLEVATKGTQNMLELANDKKVKSLLFFSSSEVYGDPDPNFVPTPETYPGNVSCIGPRACYDESKRLGETLCMIYFKMKGVPVKIVRPFNVYGPGMTMQDNRVVPRFLTSALKHEPLPVHEGGNRTRTFCYIADALTGFFKVLLSQKNGEVFNVGNDDSELNIMNLAQVVSEIFHGKVEIKSIDYPQSYPQGDPRRRAPDLTKIKKLLRYKPEINLHSGLRRTLAWYKEEINK